MFKFELPVELAERIDNLEADLTAFTMEARAQWESHSERWREGTAGCAAGAWMDELDHLCETLVYLDKNAAKK